MRYRRPMNIKNSNNQNSLASAEVIRFVPVKNRVLIIIAAALLFISMLASAHKALSEEEFFAPLPGEGESCKIGSDYTFKYSFDKTPQLGTVILRIQLFDKNGDRVTGLKITGESGMPSMRGHHDTGMIPFMLNKKGDYLLPVNVVMPGTWDIRMVFIKDSNPIYKGSITFDV